MIKIEFRGILERRIRALAHRMNTNPWDVLCKALSFYQSYLDHKEKGRQIMIVYPDNTEKEL